MNDKSFGYGSESDNRTPYFAYRQILNELFHVLNEKYFLTGKLDVLVNEMKSKHPALCRSEDKLSTSRSNSLLYGDHDDNNSPAGANLIQAAAPANNKGIYRDMLSLFFKKSDPALRVFDYNFPGLWSALGTNISVPQGDQKIILSVFLTNFLNFCTASDIRIHITLDDFQVSKKILSSKTEF